MALITLQQVSLAFGGRPLLEQVNLQVEPGERLCLLGRNGEGKSTLMRLLNGEVEADDGEIVRRKGLRCARLEQEVPPGLTGTVYEVVAGGPGPVDQLHLEKVLSRLELPPEQEFAQLSGGLKRRVLLARALAGDPELLLLDEPTNHLDIAAITRLEEFLLAFPGALLFVTHDRQLVRRLATRIIELDRGRLTSWPGDYDNYLRRREENLAAESTRNAKFDRKLAEEEAWIRQGVKARRTRNQGRVEALLRLRRERAARREQSGPVKMRIQDGERSGRLVVEAKGVSFAYAATAGEAGKMPAEQGLPPGRTPSRGQLPEAGLVISELSTTIMRGDKVGIIGPNGVGKSTLLKLLLGQLAPTFGQLRPGANLEVCYFDQHREQLDPERTVAENLAEGRDTVLINGQSRHVLGYLQDFLFTPDRARSPVAILSGGEKNRLLLARLFTRPCNVLVLDEPTNDLDVETLELLEELLLDFNGTLLLVSHDRAFLDNVVTSTLVFEGGGRVVEYAGGYGDWLRQRRGAEWSGGGEDEIGGKKAGGKVKEERKPIGGKTATGQGSGAKGGGSAAAGNKADGREVAPGRSGGARSGSATVGSGRSKLTFTERHELAELPARIEALEADQAKLTARLAAPDFYRLPAAEIAAHQQKLAEVEAQLAQVYRRWEELDAG